LDASVRAVIAGEVEELGHSLEENVSLINLRLQLGWGSYASISQHLRRLALRQGALQAQRTSGLSHAQAGAEAPRRPTRLDMLAAKVARL